MFDTAPQKRRYQIKDILGRGGMATVYRARDKHTGKDVALKVSTRGMNDLAEAEARITASLSHPHIICLLESFKTRRHHYLVYELLEGGELFDRIVRLVPLHTNISFDDSHRYETII